jgi:hypothetical protein
MFFLGGGILKNNPVAMKEERKSFDSNTFSACIHVGYGLSSPFKLTFAHAQT